jgi:hypothetical protein
VALARSKAKAASLFERIRAEADEGQRARKPTPTLSTPQVSTGDQASPVSVAKRSHVDPDAVGHQPTCGLCLQLVMHSSFRVRENSGL